MFKKVYVVTRYHTIDDREKHWLYATVEQIGGNYNLIHAVDRLKNEGAEIILVCATKKEAQEVAAGWNNQAREAGHLGFAEWANEDYHEQERKAI